MVRKNQVGAIAEVQAALYVNTGFRERLNFGDEGCGVYYDAGADDCLLFGAQDATGDELQDETIFADDYGVTSVVAAGDARDIVESSGEIIDDFAFALVAPLRADHHDRFHAAPSLAHIYHPHTSLSASEEEMSGGNCKKNYRINIVRRGCFWCKHKQRRERFDTEGTEVGTRSPQRRGRLARGTA